MRVRDPIESPSLGTVAAARERARALRRAFAGVHRAGFWLWLRLLFIFYRDVLIRASSCQRFVSAPLLSSGRPTPRGDGGIRQMNTFESNSTQTDNSPSLPRHRLPEVETWLFYASSPQPLGPPNRAWPRLTMRSLPSGKGEEQSQDSERGQSSLPLCEL